MAKDQVVAFQETGRDLEREANAVLGDVHDQSMSLVLSDGRTLRRALQDLAEFYEEKVEQMLWTKWAQRIARSECKVLLAKLAVQRAAYMAYLSDLDDTNVNVRIDVPMVEGATATDVTNTVIEEERKTLALIAAALEGGK